MVAVQASEGDVRPYLDDAVNLAAVNGPDAVVLSGSEDAVLAVAARFEAQGRRSRRLQVSHAFHSALMDPMLEEFRAVAEELSFSKPSVPVVSTVTGGLADDLATAEYWVRQVRDSVRFADALRCLDEHGVTTFLELGPDGVLTGLARQSAASTHTCVPLLRTGRPEAGAVVEAVGELYAAGTRVDWEGFFGPTGAHRVALPTYAFQRERHWLEHDGDDAANAVPSGLDVLEHPLLTARTVLPGDSGAVLTGRLSLSAQPWLADHRVDGTVLFPGAGFVELAIRTGDEVGCQVLDSLVLHTPLVLPERGGAEIQTVVGAADADGGRTLVIRSRTSGEQPWTDHAEGVVVPEKAGAEPTPSAWPPAGATELDTEGAYELLAGRGYGYGPLFQGLRAAWTRGDEVFAEVALPDLAQLDAQRFGVHPALLDACLHAILLAAW